MKFRKDLYEYSLSEAGKAEKARHDKEVEEYMKEMEGVKDFYKTPEGIAIKEGTDKFTKDLKEAKEKFLQMKAEHEKRVA